MWHFSEHFSKHGLYALAEGLESPRKAHCTPEIISQESWKEVKG
jgi:hypothetical protein